MCTIWICFPLACVYFARLSIRIIVSNKTVSNWNCRMYKNRDRYTSNICIYMQKSHFKILRVDLCWNETCTRVRTSRVGSCDCELLLLYCIFIFWNLYMTAFTSSAYIWSTMYRYTIDECLENVYECLNHMCMYLCEFIFACFTSINYICYMLLTISSALSYLML